MTKTLLINDKGIEEIRKFLNENMKGGAAHLNDSNLFSWAADAEFQMSIGNPPTIELKAHESIYGHVVEYTVSKSGVDYRADGE